MIRLNLSAMYGLGTGVLQDDVYAHMWSNISALNGNKGAADNRDIFDKRMTQSQLEKVQDLAGKCVAKN